MKLSITANKLINFAKKLAAVLFWIAAWQILFFAVNNEFLIASPMNVAARLFELCGTLAFWQSALSSVLRVLLGFAVGVITGALLAWAVVFIPVADELISPAVRVIRSTPVASFIILALIWIKTNSVPVFISFLMVLPVVFENVREGFLQAPIQLLQTAKVFSLSPWKTFITVRIPAVKPHFVSAFISALGLAWKSGIAAEVLCLPKQSIGYELYSSKIYLETTDLFAWTAVVILLSMLIEKVLVTLLRRALMK